ncbi:uncharacterized protein [Lepeophtheirus salmonis]|uniref:uncharacterized protein n=1 Tax=Lepeophtheirus salmonis TaxID=72036 RepID=UPI001AEACC74|nr:uncharacterized protein LOC121129339 [Lepeophtheirus salmonis]XP_040581353.1 uncharacterized protein LOC121129696 [Lepeophtheirus salmonis]
MQRSHHLILNSNSKNMKSFQSISLIIASVLLSLSVADKPPGFGGSPPLGQYASSQSSYGSGFEQEVDPIAALADAIPGVPGEDYPIYSEVPETSFVCDGQIEGGYYADPEAQCQAFHICGADASGGLAKYSFLCPNGTLFNQEYFICDWWFNFDCAQAEELYSRNEEIAAEREAAAGDLDAYGSAPAGYGAPSNGYGSPSSSKSGSAKYNKPSPPSRRPSPKRKSSNKPSSGYGSPSSPAPGGYGSPVAPQSSYQF